ncbi:unnamed protein product [Phytophthora lilii]|uniref:Unnamed protein product n=1 Tax=Phytophthora lilii TaxID=2077276 RepID=A0A9W6TG60_9STRA|nr:unnamed protein product [Phytophthora lilii]
MTHAVRALLLCVQLISLVHSQSEHCSKLRIPPANVEHALVHVDGFSAVEEMANTTCTSYGVPSYKCGNIKKEMLETMQEMARLAIREAVVNVSLDRSLAYDVWLLDEKTQGTVKAPEPIVVYPEKPLEETVSEYCNRFRLDNQSCDNAARGVNDLLARDWGCDDPVENTEDEGKEFVEIPILLDQQDYQMKIGVLGDGTADAARFCVEKDIDIAQCAELFRVVQKEMERLEMNRLGKDEVVDTFEWGENIKRQRQLRVDNPIDTRLYPQSERIHIKVHWEQNESEEEIVPEEICLCSEYSTTPVKCFMVPQTDSLHIAPNSKEGYHLLYFTDKSGKEILGATVFHVVVPKAELLEFYTSPAEAGTSGSEVLAVKIRTTLFDPFDSGSRVCVLLDGFFDCLDPEWMTIEEREFRHGTSTKPAHQSVTFRSQLDHVPFDHANGHEISILLLTDTNKAVHLSSTIAFDAASTVNQPETTSRLHVLDPRLNTPQRPRTCPLSVPSLRWICDLWRHEWGLYSQNGEDGILNKIFRHIGTKHKAYVEFGTENGQECNTRLLREIHEWKGLLMDSRYEDESINLYREYITRDNFMPLLAEKYQKLVPRDLDLLSIDVDFNDFWLLSALDLELVAPRVILVEVNSHIPPNEARTVQYDDRVDGSGGWDGFSSYFGGSVAAFHRWGALHGYSLVYCESHGVNCFFVRNDALGGANVSEVLGPEQLQAPPNFFGQGWDYPDTWQPHHKWVWL